MTPGRTIEKKGDTGVQDKDGKTAQGGSMTRQQAEQEMEQLRKVFPSVRMLTAEQVQAGEAVGDAARQALEEKTTHSRMEYRGQELYEVTALFAQVEGTPCVLELERRLDRIMLLDPEESEQLFNNLAEYRGKLYRDAVTGAYNERYYQEKSRSRIADIENANIRPSYSDRWISLDSLGGKKAAANAADAIAAEAGYIPVYFSFVSDGRMAAGDFADVCLLLSSEKKTIAVPDEAIVEQIGNYFVYVKSGDHSYEKRRIEKGESNGTLTQVTSGLADGDIVVTKGATMVRLAETANAIPEGHSHNH